MSETGKARLREYLIGGVAQFALTRDTTLAKLPDEIDCNTGARLGYAGTSFAVLKKGGMKFGSTILINGVTGTLGYATVAIALGLGATKILGLGRKKERVQEIESLSSVKGRVLTRSASRDDGMTLGD